MNLGIEQLRLLLTVIDTGSFSAAARQLKRAPSAVSMAIANMEADLNLNLFDRAGREPVATSQALALAVSARVLLQQLQQWQAQALGLSGGLESKLSIAIEPELLSIHWADYIAALAKRFPQLTIEILSAPHEDAMHWLHEGRVQLALLYERSEFDGRENFQELLTEELVAVAAPHHDLFRQPQPIHLDHLVTYRQIVVASREQTHVTPRLLWSPIYWHTDSHIAALNLLLQGLGWAILPRSFVAPYLLTQQLALLTLDNLSNSFPLCVDVVWSRLHPLGSAARHLITLMQPKAQNKSV